MGQEQSTLKKEGYKIEEEIKNGVMVTKGGDRFFVRTVKISTNEALISEIEDFKTISHPHVISVTNSFKDEDQDTYYVVTEYCQGQSLAEKIGEKRLSESEIMSWIVEICMALRAIHEKGFLHKHLKPQNIFFNKFGTLQLDRFQEIQGNKTNVNTAESGRINYLAPEVFTQATYDAKSDIWSVGCILYELCTQQLAFSAGTRDSLKLKINSGPPRLSDKYSSELRELLADMLKKDPNSRPTALEILERPIALNSLLRKCKTTADHLQTQLDKLRSVADSLENVHTGATVGSLAGGVIGAAGGITSIVGLILAPFTLGTSLIVTGVGVGVAVAGGVAAGASNITNMVNQSSDRKAVESIIKEFNEKINAIALWAQEISIGLEAFNARHPGDIPNNENSSFSQENYVRFGARVGRGLGGISELVRLLQVVNVGKIAAQASRVVRVAEVAGGVLSALFVAADIFFIAMDAKEIYKIRQTQADGTPCSEIMKFAQSIRNAADELQKVLDEFKAITDSIPFLDDERELQWEPMETM